MAVAPAASYREGVMHGYGKGRESKGHGLAGGVTGWSYLALPLPLSPFSFLPTLASRFLHFLFMLVWRHLTSPHKNSVVKRVGCHASPYTSLRALLGS
jgi:hypothetical protein